MSTQKKKISVLLADDHLLARQGVRSILEKAPDIEVVGEAKDGDETKLLVAELRPNILLLDLKMPHMLSPAALEEWVRTNYPETITLVLTGHDRDIYLSNMMDAAWQAIWIRSCGQANLSRPYGALLAGKFFLIKSKSNGRGVGGKRQVINGIFIRPRARSITEVNRRG